MHQPFWSLPSTYISVVHVSDVYVFLSLCCQMCIWHFADVFHATGGWFPLFPPQNAFLGMQHWRKPKHNPPLKCDNKAILNLTWWNTSGQWVIIMLSLSLFFTALRFISSTLSADSDWSKRCGVNRNPNSKKIQQCQKMLLWKNPSDSFMLHYFRKKKSICMF